MRYYMVALSLPRRGYYLCLHKHGRPELCRWTELDRDNLIRVKEQILNLYERGPLSTGFSRPEVELIYDKDLTPVQAANRVIPYYLEATPPNQKRVYYIEAKESDVEVIKPAGTEDEQFGVHLVTVARGAGTLNLLPEVIAEAGNPDLATIEGRSSRRLAEVVAWHEGPVAVTGNAKILAVPADRPVQVSRTPDGEVVTEIPKVWA